MRWVPRCLYTSSGFSGALGYSFAQRRCERGKSTDIPNDDPQASSSSSRPRGKAAWLCSLTQLWPDTGSTAMATSPELLEPSLIRAAWVAGLDGPALYFTVALGQAAIAAGLTPLALDWDEVRGRTERMKRQLVSYKVT